MIEINSLRNDLRSDEGFRPYAYIDTTGNTTVGYGFNIQKGKAVGLPKAVAEFWLSYNIGELNEALIDDYPWFRNMSSARCNVVLEMAYQLGLEGLAKFKHMIACLSNADYKGAARECRNSKAYGQATDRWERHAKALEIG